MRRIRQSASEIQAKIEELRSAVHRFREYHQETKAAALAHLAERLEDLLFHRGSLTAKTAKVQ